jgi:diphthamide synthase subunit DPH2
MKPTTKNVPEDLKKAVEAYMLARAYAELQREAVDAIERRILAENQHRIDPEHVRRGMEKDKVILEPKNVYLMGEKQWQFFLSDVRQELEKAGYKIEQAKDSTAYWSYICPALSAESVQRDAERLVIACAAQWLGMTPEQGDKISRCFFGLDQRQRFIDLNVSLVVSLPDFKKPVF